MNKKKILIILTLVVVLLVSFTVFAVAADVPAAANIRKFFGVDTSKLTDQQKSDLNDSLSKIDALKKDTTSKMAELQKEAITKMIANGSMTQEQGDAAIKKIDEMAKNPDGNGFSKGLGMGKGNFEPFQMKGLDTSKLTDQQKADLKDTYSKMIELQKEAVNKMIANGSITKEQGDTVIKKIDEMAKSLDANGFPKAFAIGRGGFDFLGIKGLNTSKLTEQQKADLKDSFNKMADLQKENINKMVADTLITKEQGDAAIKGIEEMVNNFDTNGLMGEPGIGKKGFEGHKGQPNPKDNTNTTSVQ